MQQHKELKKFQCKTIDVNNRVCSYWFKNDMSYGKEAMRKTYLKSVNIQWKNSGHFTWWVDFWNSGYFLLFF